MIVKIISMVGGARDPEAPNLFQISNLDNGEFKFVHAADVIQIVNS